MDCDSGKEFPKAFGDTPDDFLDRFGGLIYTIILRICKQERMVITPEVKYVVIRLDPQSVFNGFIAHIAKDYYRVLRKYEHRNNAQPQTYLGKVIRWFTLAEMKREEKKSLREAIDEDEVLKARAVGDPSENLIKKEQENLLHEALEAAKAKLKDDKKKLVIELFYAEGKKAGEIASLFNMKEKAVFKITERYRELCKIEIKKRGISEFG